MRDILHSDFGLVFWIHSLLILGALASPFYLDYRVILILLGFYILQFVLFKQCVLSIFQFGKVDGFYHHYAARLGLKWKRRTVSVVSNLVLPGYVLVMMLIWQVVLQKEVWLAWG